MIRFDRYFLNLTGLVVIVKLLRSFLAARRRATHARLLGSVLLALAPGVARAQTVCESLRPEQPADYYTARGCGLLQSVEQYHLGPGRERLRLRQYSSAYGDFRFILNQFPNHPTALLLMAQTCEQWNTPQCQPGEFFENALAFKGDSPGTYIAQGIYLHRAHQFPKAIESFKKALELDPDSMNAHYNLGLSYVETKQYDLANEEAQKAYALGAQLPGLRQLLERAGRWKPAGQNTTSERTGATPNVDPTRAVTKK